MFTSFILVHTPEGDEMMVNIMDISYILDNQIFLRSRKEEDVCIEVAETFEQLNDKLCKELSNDN